MDKHNNENANEQIGEMAIFVVYMSMWKHNFICFFIIHF